MLAPAKINLFFHLTGKRADGYHEVQGLVTFASIGDVLTITPAPKTQLTIRGEFASSLEGVQQENTILRVLEFVEQRMGQSYPLSIMLDKQLPVASGMGGGTADGAALLRYLHQEHPEISESILREAAQYMGADGMVCFKHASAFMEGIGEVVTPVPLPVFGIVLVNPRLPLATRDVFESHAEPFAPKETILSAFSSFAGLIDYLAPRKNHLQHAAIKRLPVIAHILASIERTSTCRLARMSGSGATCFGLYDTPQQADDAARQLKTLLPDMWIVSATAGG